jgi:hypothetical protein
VFVFLLTVWSVGPSLIGSDPASNVSVAVERSKNTKMVCLEFDGTRQLPVSADCISLLGECINATKKQPVKI